MPRNGDAADKGAQAPTDATATPETSNVAGAVRATTAGTASTQAQLTGDQSQAPGRAQVADVATRAPATSMPLGIPMAAPFRSAFDQLRDNDPNHPLVSATPAGEEPRGDQALPAVMTPGGSLPITQNPDSHAAALARIVTSPTATPQDVGATRFRPHHRLPEDFVRSLNRHEIRSLINDRGYDIDDLGGRRALTSRFLAAQKDDDSLTDPEESGDDSEIESLEDADEQVTTADTAPTTTTGAGEGGTTTDQASGKPSGSK